MQVYLILEQRMIDSDASQDGNFVQIKAYLHEENARNDCKAGQKVVAIEAASDLTEILNKVYDYDEPEFGDYGRDEYVPTEGELEREYFNDGTVQDQRWWGGKPVDVPYQGDIPPEIVPFGTTSVHSEQGTLRLNDLSLPLASKQEFEGAKRGIVEQIEPGKVIQILEGLFRLDEELNLKDF